MTTTATPWPAIGVPLCWCGDDHGPDEYGPRADLAARGHVAPGTYRYGSSISAADGASWWVGPVERVATGAGLVYRQRRATISDGRRLAHLTLSHSRDGWRVSWAGDDGWQLLDLVAVPRGWLTRHHYGPDTFGHVEYTHP